MLQAIVNQEVFDKLGDAVKAEYKKQSDGTFILDVSPVKSGDAEFALENVKGLKSALSKERTDREDAERKLKSFDGLDVEKAREALKKVEEMASWKPEDKVREQIELIKKQLTDKHTGELGAKDQSIQTLTAQLEKVLIEAEAIKAITELKGNAALLLPHVKGFTRMKKMNDGSFVVEVLGKDGNPRISPAANSTAPMTIAELVAEMKTNDTFAPAFEGTGSTGTGASTGKGKGGVDLSKMSPQEKMRYARQQNKT